MFIHVIFLFRHFASIDPRGFSLLTDSSAVLTPSESLWPGRYTVGLLIRDQQGKACPGTQLFKLHVCSCVEETVCGAAEDESGGASFKFGTPGIMVVFLGALLLLCEYSSHVE